MGLVTDFLLVADNLPPGWEIDLAVVAAEPVEALMTVFSDPRAPAIRTLTWAHSGESGMVDIIPHLPPNLTILQVDFPRYPMLDFLSLALQHKPTITELGLKRNATGDIQRFFDALERSHVHVLTVGFRPSSVFVEGLCAYLQKNRLTRLHLVADSRKSAKGLLPALVSCERLTELTLTQFRISPDLALPSSVTTLALQDCSSSNDRWGFLTGRTHIILFHLRTTNVSKLGRALAAVLRATGLDVLRVLYPDNDVCQLLSMIGLELGRAKIVEVRARVLRDVSGQIADVLMSPHCEIKELTLESNFVLRNLTERLVPALRQSTLTRLRLVSNGGVYCRQIEQIEQTFQARIAVLTMLQGQQVRRLRGPLRRLPVEMMRLVGGMLL